MDGTSGRQKSDDVVYPGETVRMIWNVTQSDAPGSGDPACIPWVYHSHINTVSDTSAGLIGVLVTCKPGEHEGGLLSGYFHYKLCVSDALYFLTQSISTPNQQ